MKKTQLTALFLACVVSAGLFTTSCRRSNDDSKNGENSTGANIISDEALPPLVLPENPDELTGYGEDFDIFIAYSVSNADFIAEEETGNTITDIIYQRNIEVEDYFNIDFKYRKGDTVNSAGTPVIRQLVQSGDNTYEVFVNVQHVGIPLIYEDLFVDWNVSMPYANLENPWWYQNVQRDLNFGDKIYVTAGAYNFHCLKGSGTLAFNKTMMDELELEYPYQMVLDGEWTIDKLIEYSKAAQKDLNGDGKITYDADRLGVAGWKYEMMPAFFVGMGGESVVKDENNMPKLNINNERTFNIIDKMIELFDDGNGAWMSGEVYATTTNMFKESRLLFHDTTLDSLPGLRDMEDDFGAIPYPKLDEDQESYYARIVNFSSLTYIPVTNDKLALTSAVLEHMAYLSYKDLIPAYYDVILEIKTTRDVDTEAMIDIIRENARFMDENFLTSGTIHSIVEGGQNTLSSNYASRGDAWEQKLETLREFWGE